MFVSCRVLGFHKSSIACYKTLSDFVPNVSQENHKRECAYFTEYGTRQRNGKRFRSDLLSIVSKRCGSIFANSCKYYSMAMVYIIIIIIVVESKIATKLASVNLV